MTDLYLDLAIVWGLIAALPFFALFMSSDAFVSAVNFVARLVGVKL